MESNKRKKRSKSPEKDLKEYYFRNLPDGSGHWIVIAWGKIVNDRDQYYQQEIVLAPWSAKRSPDKIFNLTDPSRVVYVQMDLGSLRAFTPGTIIRKKRIIKYPHEYLEKVNIAIEDPQAMEKRLLVNLYQPGIKEMVEFSAVASVDKIMTRFSYNPAFGRLIIPCNVIADYYYYGFGTYMIAAILEGNINPRFANGNDLYNPKKMYRDVSPTGKVVVRMELQRKMDLRDKYKIARLAHDDFFRDKCLDISYNIMNGKLVESYVDTDFPVNQPIVLSVYGQRLRIENNSNFLVYSIAMCSSKAPFDLVFAAKPFRGKATLPDSGGNGTGDDTLGLGPKDPPKKSRERKKLEPSGTNIIDPEPPQWNGIPEDVPFVKDQEDNFPDDAAINELDLADPEKREEILKTLLKFGVAPRASTNPKKSGSGNVLPLSLTAQGPAKPRPAPPTEAFEIIENLAAFLEVHFKKKSNQTELIIRCPVPEGIDKYSAFPVLTLLKETDVEKKMRYLFFVFQHIQQKGHTHHRRVFINELTIDGHYFYIMDIEPKYKKYNEKGEVAKLLSSAGVIFYAGAKILSDGKLTDILEYVVKKHQTPEGRWEFLRKQGFTFERITHHSGQRSYDSIVKFITARIPKKK